MIWNPQMECLPHEQMTKLQLKRLQQTLTWVYERVPFYRQRMDDIGCQPGDVKSLEDLAKFPFTVKNDLRDNYPYGLFAVPLSDVVRLHASSGTTGKPIVVGYNQYDLDAWSENIARIVTMAGVTRDDVAQIAFGYGLFTGAFGLHYGLEKAGATVIPISGGNTERQLMIMKDFGTTTLISTPTYALHMAEEALAMGINPRDDLKVRWGLFGGEACSEEYRKQIEELWGMVATDNYGLSEVGGPGMSGECLMINGQHINEDSFIVEILDPQTFEPVEPGQLGEVVITTINRQTIPMIRYRTKDISSINYEPCACGRTTARLSKITGRTDDMLIIRGVNVFPSQIESVIMEVEGLAPHYQLIVTRKGYLDNVEVQVEISPDVFVDDYGRLEEIEDKLKQNLFRVLNIHLKTKLLEAGSIERTAGKAKRVIDLRK
ncbi:MAG: phenylacetate--CoA ligase family protein [Methylocystaceae bacterium]